MFYTPKCAPLSDYVHIATAHKIFFCWFLLVPRFCLQINIAMKTLHLRTIWLAYNFISKVENEFPRKNEEKKANNIENECSNNVASARCDPYNINQLKWWINGKRIAIIACINMCPVSVFVWDEMKWKWNEKEEKRSATTRNKCEIINLSIKLQICIAACSTPLTYRERVLWLNECHRKIFIREKMYLTHSREKTK